MEINKHPSSEEGWRLPPGWWFLKILNCFVLKLFHHPVSPELLPPLLERRGVLGAGIGVFR